MSIRRPDLGTFEKKLREATVEVADLVRLSRRPATEPHWSRAAYGRFDDPQTGAKNQFGVCYASNSLSVAFAESIVHESSTYSAGRYLVAEADLKSRSIVRFSHPTKHQLVLADLTGEGLKAVGLNNDISAGGDYTLPQLWAQAIYRSNVRWDGIRYVSRQQNRGVAVALFDRSGLVKASHQLLEGPTLDMLCDLYDVGII